MYKHYIRLNEQKEVIQAFSNAFVEPQADDICLTPDGTEERHFNINLMAQGIYQYTYDGELKKKPEAEIEAIARKNTRITEIKSRLAAIDAESIRPLRAKGKGKAAKDDEDKLAALEAEAEELREELRRLV